MWPRQSHYRQYISISRLHCVFLQLPSSSSSTADGITVESCLFTSGWCCCYKEFASLFQSVHPPLQCDLHKFQLKVINIPLRCVLHRVEGREWRWRMKINRKQERVCTDDDDETLRELTDGPCHKQKEINLTIVSHHLLTLRS